MSLWDASILSLSIGAAATVLTGVVGVPLAFLISRRAFFGRSVVEGVLMMPLVLPPTVVGYLILVVFGKQGWVGRYLYEWFGYTLLMRFEGAVLAAAVVALPLFYMPSRAAFSGVDQELEDVARLFGATRLQMFFHVSLPLAMRGVIAGGILAFARALGEFGATLMVFTWQPARETLPIMVYADYEFGSVGAAWPAVVAMSGMSLVLVMGYNRWSAKQGR